MRTLCRSGPWLVALGVALAGCSNASGPTSKAPAGSSPTGVTSSAEAGTTDVTLLVPGMT